VYYFEQYGNYRTSVAKVLAATSEFPLDIRLMYERTVVSPMDLSQRERHIAEILKCATPKQPRDCDALVFGYGEPECRTATKIGGAPYWPNWRPWPADNGQLLEFLVQINFCGSEDLVPSLPGQMLSLFAKENGWDLPTIFPFWQDIDRDVVLIDGADIPEIENGIVATPAFAVACRITEYADSTIDSSGQYSDLWEDVAVIRGSKIGGCPRFFSDAPPSTGAFLAAIHSLRHPLGQPWVFVNHSDPLTPEQLGGLGVSGGRGCHDTVMFGDQGTLYLYLEDNGRVNIRMQCWGMDELLTIG
jgi:hypothetical protein